MQATQEAAMAPSLEASAMVQSSLIDAEVMKLLDQTLANEAIVSILNESLCIIAMMTVISAQMVTLIPFEALRKRQNLFNMITQSRFTKGT